MFLIIFFLKIHNSLLIKSSSLFYTGKKKENKSQQSSGQQPSPLALLAATCSKLEETGTSESPQPQQAVQGGKNQQNNLQAQTVKVINSGSQVLSAADFGMCVYHFDYFDYFD